ncbi:MAG TPA: PAS domain-containing protein [Holophaga sp.]|nr:PAS domain-containing protein [Holophaga sp.]
MPKPRPPQWLAAYAPIAEAIARLFHPFAEVAIHDLASDRIVALWNPFSKRKVGDPALLSELPEDIADRGVYGPYAKVLPDGRALTSVSAVLADPQGTPCGLLCVNFDRSPLDGVAEMLARFAAPAAPRPPELFNRDWRERIALVIDEACRDRQLRRDRLTREDRLALVRAVNDKGLFSTRQAAHHVALALGVSRATVYALLKEVTSC